MVMEDLQRIIPDGVRQLASRKVYVALISVIVFLGVAVLVLGGVLAAHRAVGVALWTWNNGAIASTEALYQQQHLCARTECLHTAAWIGDNLDAKAATGETSPCDDFYRFACGGWAARNSIPPDRGEVTLVEQIEVANDERLREIIERPSVSTSPTSAERKLKDFFRSCVHDYGRMKEAGAKLLSVIRGAVGEWYGVNPTGWNSAASGWDVQKAIGNVQSDLLVGIVFSVYYQSDWPLNPNKNIMRLTYPNFGVGSYMFFNNNNTLRIQDAYKDYMRTVGSLLLRDANLTLSPSEQQVRVEQFVSDVYGHEESIAKILRNVRQYMSQRVTVGQLQSNYSQIAWQRILSQMFVDLTVTDDTVLVVRYPAYFNMINQLLLNESAAHIRDRILNNYMVWRVVGKYAEHLSWEYRQASNRYMEAAYGVTEWPPTWETCLTTVKDRLGSLVAGEYIKAHIGTEARTQVKDMYDNVKAAVIQRLTELPWMDNITANRAIEKLSAIKSVIGFSDIYYNDTYLDQIHLNLVINASAGYFTNVLNLNKFQRRMRLQLALLPEGDTAFHPLIPLVASSYSYQVQPYLSWYYNEMHVPAIALTAPLYNSRRPRVLNYGILGSVVAAELLRAIGETGKFYWTNQSFALWWTNETSVEYRKTKECFEKYFDGLTAGPFLINGVNKTVPVNGRQQSYRLMDDLGGIKTAIRAYRQWSRSNGVESMPVGLNMTADQLFFVAAAQTKCFLRSDQNAYTYARYGYLPEDFELNNILSHIPEFTEAFNCPIGSKLKLAYQCQAF